MAWTRPLAVLFLCACLAGCDDDMTGDDAGPGGMDAGPGAIDGGGDSDGGGGSDAGPGSDGGGGTDDGGASGDAGPPIDGGDDPCGAVDALPRTCSTDEDCDAVLHQSDCCGTLVARGISSDARMTFDLLEPVCRASLPACDCPAQPTMTDNGEVVTDPSAVQVACVARGPTMRCVSYVSMRPVGAP